MHHRFGHLPAMLALVAAASVFGAGTPPGPSRFVPDFRVQSDDYTVLMAADGQNPAGAKVFVDDHRRMQMRHWPLGGQTRWAVDAAVPGEYAVNVLFQHSVNGPLRVTVSTAQSHCLGLAEPEPGHAWRRFSLPGTLQLAKGRNTVVLGISAAEGGSEEKLEVLSLELVRPEVKARLHRAAMDLRAQADPEWFRTARYGLMFHWTSDTVPRHGSPKPHALAVRDFDLQTFVAQVVQTGARFVTLTTSHGSMYFPAPLPALDRVLPGRSASRDLVGELAAALDRHGIRLILYYHLGSNADKAWQAASGFWKTDTSEFWRNWTAVITEVGERYGDKLAGWWFDDGTANYYYRSAPWERLARAAKAGNPKRLICFNPWILPPATEFQDYLAGESFTDPTVKGMLKAGDRGRISGGAYAGLQASSALVMEGGWLHAKRDTEIGAPRYTVEQAGDLMRRFSALENVLIFNLEIYQEGTLSPASVEVLRAARDLAFSAAPAGRE
jgi:hypothetical protein